jgi:signal transduction histidine kinase
MEPATFGSRRDGSKRTAKKRHRPDLLAAASALDQAQHDEGLAARERLRIALDLHDDLGAKLLTIVHANDAARMAELAAEALDDMRLIVGDLSGRSKHLDEAVADWRSEFVDRLTDAGIEAAWDATVDDHSIVLVSRTYMQLTRILREAVSNVIKHSRAKRCSARCRVTFDALHLDIRDDGRGVAAGTLQGNGTLSMQTRAADADGICAIESSAGAGVTVRVSVPLRTAAC